MNTHADKTQENKNQLVTNAVSQKQRSNNATLHFVDRRPETIIQRKIQGMANNQFTIPIQKKEIVEEKRLQGNLENGQVRSNQVVQRNKHLKRFKNVMTLGLRKPYVKHRRANRVPAVQPQPQPNLTPLEQFVEAYGKSRYYHQTDQSNLDSINENGLLNFQDRAAKLQEQVYGMSRLGGEYEGDEKKGVFLGPKKFMKENQMTTNTVRAFLPKERTNIHHWTEEETTPTHEMFRDEKFRGGAVVTKDSIPAEQVTTEKMSDLLEDNNPRLNSILASVGSQYKEEPPSHEEMKTHLRRAILERQLSNAAFDDETNF